MRRSLDAIDLEILAVMYREGAISNKALASRVGIAPSTALERVRRLKESGVLRAIRAQIDLKAIGVNMQAIVAIQLNHHTAEAFRRFRDEVLLNREVLSLYHMGGENDFFVHVAVGDAEHLRDFIYRVFTSNAAVKHVETAIVYEHCLGRLLPIVSRD